jgi:hypothetical protein
MKTHSKLEKIVMIVLILVCGFFGFAWYQAEGKAGDRPERAKSVTGITEALRITKAEGTKSIGQLIRELPPDSGPIPDQAIKSFHFFIDPFNDALIFPAVPNFQPDAFQWGILPGQDKFFTIPKIALTAPEGLNFYLVKTNGTCNFLLILEFYPKDDDHR